MFIRLNKLSRQMTIASGLALASVSSAFAASDNANATATVIAPIAIAKVSDLLFGNIIAGTGGTIAVDAADSVSLGGNVTVPPTQTGTRAAAVFNVSGEGTNTYAITLPANSVVVITGPGTDMNVNVFVSNPSGTGALTAGAQQLKVGATLTVGSPQTAGAYTGAFTVTVAYN